MRLQYLVGEHVLKSVPRMDVRHPTCADAKGVLFELDDKTYLAFEDPNDGYRSSLGVLLSFEGPAYSLGYEDAGPEYLHIRVVCSHETAGAYHGEADLLVMRVAETGAEIFRLGTDNTDDYYPSFVADWQPSNLPANARR